MTKSPFYIHTPFDQPFVLDKAKLTRIVGIVLDRLPGLTVFITPVMSNKAHVHLQSLDELFAMDNTRTNPITELRLVFNNVAEKAKVVEIVFRSGARCRVSMAIGGVASNAASQLSAELQEQFERTFVRDWKGRIRHYSFPIFSLIALCLMSFILISESRNKINVATGAFSTEEMDRLQDDIRSASNIERKVDVLLEIESTRLSNRAALVASDSLSRYLTRKTLLVGIPLVVIIVVAGYMLIFLYPVGIFVWGDFEEYYQKILERRKFCFGVVIAGVVINLLAAALWLGLSSA
jgi:hypothetical protein